MNNGSIFVKLILGQLINGRKKRIICCRSIHQTAAGAIQTVQHTGKASATLILNFMSCSVHTLVLYCVVSRLKILWVVLSLTITSVGQMASQRVRGATNCSFSSDYTPLGWGQVQYEGNINSIFHRSSPVNSCPRKSFPIDIFRVCVSSKTLLFHKDLSCWSQAPEIILVTSSSWRYKMPMNVFQPSFGEAFAEVHSWCLGHFGRCPSWAGELQCPSGMQSKLSLNILVSAMFWSWAPSSSLCKPLQLVAPESKNSLNLRMVLFN